MVANNDSNRRLKSNRQTIAGSPIGGDISRTRSSVATATTASSSSGGINRSHNSGGIRAQYPLEDPSQSRPNRMAGLPKAQKTYTEPVTFYYEIQSHTSRMHKLTKTFEVYRLTLLTLICIFAGLCIGLLCRPLAADWTERQFMYIEFPGELYLRFLKLLLIPLLVSNVILSFGSIQGKLSSHLGKMAALFYLISNLLAVLVAISIALMLCWPQATSSNSPGQTQQERNEPGPRVFSNNLRPPTAPCTFSSNQASKLYAISGHQIGSSKIVSDPSAQLEDNNLQHIVASNSRPTVPPSNQQRQQQQQQQQQQAKTNANNPSIYSNGNHSQLAMDFLLDLLRNLVPENPFAATIRHTRTRIFEPYQQNGQRQQQPMSRWPFVHETYEQANILGLLALSVLTGVVLSNMDEAGRPMLELCSCIAELSLRLSLLVVNLGPICIMFLLIGRVVRTQDLGAILSEILVYLATVISALLLFGFLVLPVAFWLLTRKSPINFLQNLLEVLVASFATSSSSATLALLLSRLIQCDINPLIVRAFGPLGSVFNMTGTVIFEVIACVFMAKTSGETLALSSLPLIGLTAAVAGLSTVGIPTSGLMTLIMIANTMNLSSGAVAKIYVVDFLVDRLRTVVNVWSGALVCALINHFCPEKLIDETIEHRKFMELIKFRPGSLVKGSLAGPRGSIKTANNNSTGGANGDGGGAKSKSGVGLLTPGGGQEIQQTPARRGVRICLLKMQCPDQAHWIFVGVLVGLVSGITILWLLNCFRVPAPVADNPSTTA